MKHALKERRSVDYNLDGGSQEVCQSEPVCCNLDGFLASGGDHRRGDNTKLAQVDVAEVHSPPRVTLEAQKFSLRPGEAMDLRTGFDFNKLED